MPQGQSVGKKRIKDPIAENGLGEREFKVRIVERLSQLEHKINS